MIKICPRCKQEKDAADFGKDKNKTDGLKRWCKKCRCAYEGERYRPIKERNTRARAELQYRVTRVCSKCGQEKPINAFYRYYKDRPRVRINCIECERKYKRSPAGIASGKKYEQSEKGRLVQRRQVQLHYPRIVARYKLNNAIKLGHIGKPSKCPICGTTNDIQAHHDNYDNPLEVNFMCRKCHIKLHREKNKNVS